MGPGSCWAACRGDCLEPKASVCSGVDQEPTEGCACNGIERWCGTECGCPGGVAKEECNGGDNDESDRNEGPS